VRARRRELRRGGSNEQRRARWSALSPCLAIEGTRTMIDRFVVVDYRTDSNPVKAGDDYVTEAVLQWIICKSALVARECDETYKICGGLPDANIYLLIVIDKSII